MPPGAGHRWHRRAADLAHADDLIGGDLDVAALAVGLGPLAVDGRRPRREGRQDALLERGRGQDRGGPARGQVGGAAVDLTGRGGRAGGGRGGGPGRADRRSPGWCPVGDDGGDGCPAKPPAGGGRRRGGTRAGRRRGRATVVRPDPVRRAVRRGTAGVGGQHQGQRHHHHRRGAVATSTRRRRARRRRSLASSMAAQPESLAPAGPVGSVDAGSPSSWCRRSCSSSSGFMVGPPGRGAPALVRSARSARRRSSARDVCVLTEPVEMPSDAAVWSTPRSSQ